MTDDVEDVESFRQRARRGSAPTSARRHGRQHVASGLSDEDELAAVAHDREIQRMLFDAGFAGICFPATTAVRA